MKDQAKTKQALIQELVILRQKLAEVGMADSAYNLAKNSRQQHAEGQGGNSFASSIIKVSGINVVWNTEQGTCTFEGLPVAMMWVDTTLAGLMSGVQEMVGTERFYLALQSEGRKSVETDWQVISNFPDFHEGFKAIANIAAVAGWGHWELTSLNVERRECQFRIKDSWEGRYQKSLGVCWGSGMLAGKMAGYCSKLFATNCWADQTGFIAKGDNYDEFVVKPSLRLIEKEIEALLTSDEATRADMAVALRKLEKEITGRKHTEDALRESEKRYREMTDFLPVSIFEIDAAGGLISFNQTALKVFRYNEEDFKEHMNALQFFAPEEWQRVGEDLTKVIQGTSIPGQEYTFCRKDGSTFIGLIYSSPIIRQNNAIGIRGAIIDITDRKRAEEALTQSEEKFRKAFYTTPDSVAIHRLEDGMHIEINPAFTRITGYTKEEIIGKTSIECNIWDNVEDRQRLVAGLRKDGEVINFEAAFRRKNGDIRYGLMSASIIDLNGIPHILNIARDVTDRKQAEEALRQSQEAAERSANELAILADIGRLIGSTLEIDEVYERVVAEIRKLLSFDNLIISLYNAQQEMLDVAYVSALELPGRKVGDSHPLKGTMMEEVIRTRRGVIVQSENPQDLVDKYPSLIVSVRAGIRSLMCIPLISRNEVIGNLVMRSIKPGIYTERDLLLAEKIGMQISGAIANAQMFNELSKTEKALREQLHFSQQLLDAIPIPIFYKNYKGLYLGCNAAFQEFVGLTKEQVVGKSVHEVFPQDLADIYDQADKDLFRQSGTQVYETSFLHADGSRHDIIFNKAIYVGIDGRPSGLVGAIMDITERKHADQERQRLEERLQRSEKMQALGQLAGGVAHDLNNVLGILSGYSELLLEEVPEGSRSRGHVEKILQSTEKGAAIIQDLLTLARRGVSVSDVINLNSVISGFLKTPVFEKIADYHPHVTFSAQYDNNLLNIKGSPVHLEKTLMNLVSNAAESISGEGKVAIRTESRYLDKPLRGYDEVKEGDYAVLTVSDTGMGIPSENIEKIFEPFYTKKTMGRSGTGLGLSIVWGTVKDHNGYIDVQTEVGEGTTFTLYFPVTREEMIAPQQKVPIERYMGNGESVLVVDDIAEQREIATSLITRLGYEVHSVSSGEEAVEYLNKGNTADILVLDMIMAPGIDGLETYQRVLEINPKQKAIIVSGFSETDRVRDAQKLGAGAYVKKPYIMEKIGVAIRNELNRK